MMVDYLKNQLHKKTSQVLVLPASGLAVGVASLPLACLLIAERW